MTTFPDLPDADKIAAMRARAKTEATQYGQTTVPAMLLQGAAWGEEVVRLRAEFRNRAMPDEWVPVIRDCHARGWTIDDLAEHFECSRSYVSKIVRGKVRAKLAALEGPK